MISQEITMNYIPYTTKKATPNRMTRKQSRRKIFITNKKAKKLLRKKQRLERVHLEEAHS